MAYKRTKFNDRMNEERTALKGSHLTLDCIGCGGAILMDDRILKDFIEGLVTALGMRKILDPVLVRCDTELNSWDQGGLSAFVMIAESHISIHTFPDAGLVTADVYSCKPFDTIQAVSMFKSAFSAEEIKTQLIKREIEGLRRSRLDFQSVDNQIN
ncbi:S-adenosylmethionine decarboxylase [Flavobacteriales bacterium AH-315-E23]|nr:S-adenosylmethionine decarboxylase [Flavobacteriales bacterium AH-315-E23]